jgi:flagellar biosynthesis anti-sigma factor FlgM
MKINGERPSVLSSATEQLGKTPDAPVSGHAKNEGSATQSSDQLTLSSGAKFIQAVADDAEAPAIRQELVDRMKALLDKGEVGNDAGHLADSIIDDVLKQS